VLLIPPLFHPKFGGVPVDQIDHVGVRERIGLRLFGREIFFEEFQPMWSRYLIVTDSQTEGQTTCNLITALCVASRGKKVTIVYAYDNKLSHYLIRLFLYFSHLTTTGMIMLPKNCSLIHVWQRYGIKQVWYRVTVRHQIRVAITPRASINTKITWRVNARLRGLEVTVTRCVLP